MTQYLAGVDVGTTGARCMIFDLDGTAVARHYCDYGATYPRPGWVEQDPELLTARTMEACRAAITTAGIDPREIASIGFSAQRSVACPVTADGVPVRPMFSWQDARTAEEVEALRELISADEYYAQNGLPLGTTWIITKLLWMRKHEPQLLAKTARIVQNQDLVLRAFGADDYYTDLCCAVFYGVWDVHRATWNRPLLERLELDPALFGRPTPPGTQVGTIYHSYLTDVIQPEQDVLVYDTNADSLTALDNGTVDAVIQDLQIGIFNVEIQFEGMALGGILPGGEAGGLGLVTELDSPLIPYLNSAIAALKADGTHEALVEEWLPIPPGLQTYSEE